MTHLRCPPFRSSKRSTSELSTGTRSWYAGLAGKIESLGSHHACAHLAAAKCMARTGQDGGDDGADDGQVDDVGDHGHTAQLVHVDEPLDITVLPSDAFRP